MKDLNIQVFYGNSTFENISLDDYHDQLFTYKYDQPINAILISTYIPLFLVALLSNTIIILVVTRYRYLRSVTNYFLVNLSVADLLVTLICMPVAVGQAIHTLWLYGEIMCKLSFYLQGVAVSAGVFTITAVSIERYLAIRHPMSRKIFSRRMTRKVILGLWTLSLCLFAPILLIRKTTHLTINGSSFEFCVENWPDNLSRRSFGSFCFIVVYAIPGFIVVLAYSLMGLRLCSRNLIPEYQLNHGSPASTAANGNNVTHCDSVTSTWQVSSAGERLVRERRRVAKILLILALVFACCWFPYSVLSLVLDLQSKSQNEQELDPDNMTLEMKNDPVSIASDLLPFALLLGHVNSAVNPLLCCLLSKNFRRSIAEMIRHPTRAARSRQHCKIRMTFRKDLPDSRDKCSSNANSNNRPRNHHAPDPPPPPQSNEHHSNSGGGGCGSLERQPNTSVPEAGTRCTNIQATELLVDLQFLQTHHLHDPSIASTTSSSGYSSLRHSTDTLAVYYNKDNGKTQTQHYCGGHISPTTTPSALFWNCNCGTKFQYSTSTKKSNDSKKIEVPSTIREESDSSLKSRKKHVEFKNICITERNSH